MVVQVDVVDDPGGVVVDLIVVVDLFVVVDSCFLLLCHSILSSFSAAFTAFKFIPGVQIVTAGKSRSETGLTWHFKNGKHRFFF